MSMNINDAVEHLEDAIGSDKRRIEVLEQRNAALIKNDPSKAELDMLERGLLNPRVDLIEQSHKLQAAKTVIEELQQTAQGIGHEYRVQKGITHTNSLSFSSKPGSTDPAGGDS